MKELEKFVKFVFSSIIFPIMIFLNKKFPSTADIKYTSISKENTLARDGRENVIVYISAYSPLYLLISLNRRDTLITLITLASYGPTLKNFKEAVLSWFITISKKLAATTQKSNTFQEVLK